MARPGYGTIEPNQGQGNVIRKHGPRAKDFTNRRCRYLNTVDEAEKARNRTKSKARAKVKHSIGVIKRVFGFAKVRYSGLDKPAPLICDLGIGQLVHCSPPTTLHRTGLPAAPLASTANHRSNAENTRSHLSLVRYRLIIALDSTSCRLDQALLRGQPTLRPG
jgi:hypothetical protein